MPWEGASNSTVRTLRKDNSPSSLFKSNRRNTANSAIDIKRKLHVEESNSANADLIPNAPAASVIKSSALPSSSTVVVVLPEPTLQHSKEELIALVHASRAQLSIKSISGSTGDELRKKRTQIAKKNKEVSQTKTEVADKTKRMMEKLLRQNDQLKKRLEKEQAVSNSLVKQCSSLKQQLERKMGIVGNGVE